MQFDAFSFSKHQAHRDRKSSKEISVLKIFGITALKNMASVVPTSVCGIFLYYWHVSSLGG